MTSRSLLVYLADDDEDDRLIFEEAISELPGDIELVKAENGIKLIGLLSGNSRMPDIIFLDLNMPFQGGKEILRTLKSGKLYANIPVVVYSTSANPADIKETFEGGAFRYLEKPYSMSDMLFKLGMIFSTDLHQPAGTNRNEFFISSKEIK